METFIFIKDGINELKNLVLKNKKHDETISTFLLDIRIAMLIETETSEKSWYK